MEEQNLVRFCQQFYNDVTVVRPKAGKGAIPRHSMNPTAIARQGDGFHVQKS